MENKTTETVKFVLHNQECRHQVLIKEFAYGSPTGNYICMQCECLITRRVKQQIPSSQNSGADVGLANNRQFLIGIPAVSSGGNLPL